MPADIQMFLPTDAAKIEKKTITTKYYERNVEINRKTNEKTISF